LLRSSLRPQTVAAAAISALHEIDRQQPVISMETMDEVIAESYSDNRSNMLLLVAFAALALVLAAVGIYGLLAYSVRRRIREIGIRVALGATRSDVLRLITRAGMIPTLIGIAIGIAGSLGLARVLSTMIFGVRPIDIPTYTFVAALLAAVSLLACIVPAWRATRIDPLKALREG
jgi:putative ABC transport system permease protein